jgi:hypothetical protein
LNINNYYNFDSPKLQSSGRERFYEVVGNPDQPAWRQEIAEIGIAFDDIARDGEESDRICESLTEAVKHGIPGSTGQFIATAALEAGSRSKYPETKREILSEGIESITRHPFTSPKDKEIAQFGIDFADKSIDSQEAAIIHETVMETIESGINGQTEPIKDKVLKNVEKKILNSTEKNEMKDFPAETSESQKEKPMPAETEGKVRIGDILVSRRKKEPPPGL